eukprot:CAMPEP_0170467134 /NCGR_PEP_ID=MMETSP0123-20130129/10822_1 /TAXON_ID=182087 /ORGANISM="Favella ehrenbergii, Strain Fehren 1" /LENGTH=151 /DNA_ID=CAMNT_0010733415 /DNA_START=1666 /DNA_END=2122 /DNA_ORIENTATION=-
MTTSGSLSAAKSCDPKVASNIVMIEEIWNHPKLAAREGGSPTGLIAGFDEELRPEDFFNVDEVISPDYKTEGLGDEVAASEDNMFIIESPDDTRRDSSSSSEAMAIAEVAKKSSSKESKLEVEESGSNLEEGESVKNSDEGEDEVTELAEE